MNKAQKIQHIQSLLSRIEVLLKSKDRFAIANVYEVILAVESFFPRPPLSFKRQTASFLRKEVCSYCPSKIKPSKMQEQVGRVKREIRTYAQKLRTWLAENATDVPPEKVSVHNLDSTL
jgi:hypothetical protein